MRSYSPRHKMRSNPESAAVVQSSAVVNDPTETTAAIEIIDFLTNDTLRANLDAFGVPRDEWLENLSELARSRDRFSAAEFGLLADQLASIYFPAFRGDATELWGELSEEEISSSNLVEYANALLGSPAALYTKQFKDVLALVASDTEVPEIFANDIETGTIAEVYTGPEGKVYAALDADQPSFEYYAQQSEQGPVLGIKAEDAAFAVFNNNDTATVDVVYVVTVRSTTSAFNVIVLPELYDYVSANGETIRADFYGQLIDLNAYVSLLLEAEVEPYGLAQDENVDFLIREGLVAATRRIYDYYSGKTEAMGDPTAVGLFVEAYPDKISLAAKIPEVLSFFNIAEFPRYGHEQLVELYALITVGKLGLMGDSVVDAGDLYSQLAASFKSRLCSQSVRHKNVEQIRAVCDELIDDTILNGFERLCALPQEHLYAKLMEIDGFEKSISSGKVASLFEFRGAAYRKGLEDSKVIAAGATQLPEAAGKGADPAFDGVVGDVAGKGVKPSVERSTGSKVAGGVAVASAIVGLYALVRHSQGKPIWSFE